LTGLSALDLQIKTEKSLSFTLDNIVKSTLKWSGPLPTGGTQTAETTIATTKDHCNALLMVESEKNFAVTSNRALLSVIQCRIT